MIIALIALAAFVVLLSFQVYFAQDKIQELNKKCELLKMMNTTEYAFSKAQFKEIVRWLEKLESEVNKNE